MAGTDYDPYSILYADEPTAKEMALARAQALRGQNFAGLVGSLAHDPQAAHSGQALMQQAQSGLEQLGQEGRERIQTGLQKQHMDIQAQQLADLLRHREVLEGQAGQRIDLQKAHLDAINQGLAQKTIRYNPNTGQFENVAPMVGGARPPRAAPPAAGQPAPAAVPSGPAPAAGESTQPAPQYPPLSGTKLTKALMALKADFDPSGGRSGEFGKNFARVGAANRLLTLATDENGQPKDLNPQQMPELAQALASLISGGGAGAQSQIEHLTPSTMRGDLQRTLQWVTGNPRGADQVAFVKNMIETAQREKKVASDAVENIRKTRGPAHLVLRSNPVEAGNVLKGFGWEIGPDGLPVQSAAQAPHPPPAIDPAVVAHYKSKLQPGERLAINAEGKGKALAASDAVPPGFTEVPLGP